MLPLLMSLLMSVFPIEVLIVVLFVLVPCCCCCWLLGCLIDCLIVSFPCRGQSHPWQSVHPWHPHEIIDVATHCWPKLRDVNCLVCRRGDHGGIPPGVGVAKVTYQWSASDGWKLPENQAGLDRYSRATVVWRGTKPSTKYLGSSANLACNAFMRDPFKLLR